MMMTTPLQPETKHQELQEHLTMMVRHLIDIRWYLNRFFPPDDDDDEDYLDSFFDGILGDDDGKKQMQNDTRTINYNLY